MTTVRVQYPGLPEKQVEVEAEPEDALLSVAARIERGQVIAVRTLRQQGWTEGWTDEYVRFPQGPGATCQAFLTVVT